MRICLMFVPVCMCLLMVAGCASKLENPVLVPQGGAEAPAYGFVSEVKGEKTFFEGQRFFKVAVSGNDQYLLAHRAEGDVLIELATGRTFDLPGSRGAVFSPDSEHIAIKKRDGVAICGLDGLELVRSWGIKDEVNHMTFSPDGKRMAVCSDEAIQVFDVESGKIVFEKSLENGYAAFSPDGQKLAIRSNKNYSGPPVGIEPISGTIILSYWLMDATVGIVPDDEFYLYDLDSGRMLIERTAVDEVVRSVSLSPGGDYLAVAKVTDWETAAGGGIEVYDAVSGKKLYDLKGSQFLSGVVFAPDGATITVYSSLLSEGLTTYGLEDGLRKRHLASDNGAAIVDVDYSPDGRFLAVAVSKPVSGRGAVVLYDTDKERAVYSRITDNAVYDMAFFPGGEGLAVAGADGVRTIPLTEFVDRERAAIR